MTLYDPTIERLDEINENLRLIQLKKGLTFGTDSYLLAAFSRSRPSGVCVELGGGTGVVSLLAASRNKYKKIYAAEIQPYFGELIARNAKLNGLEGRVLSLLGDVRDLTPGNFGGEAECVISNPPYMRRSSGKDNASEEMNIARREENGCIADFCSAASRILKHGGYFTAVYRPDRLSELLSAMTAASLEPKRLVMVYPTASDKPCLVLAEGKKGAAPGIVISRPLLIYSDKQKGTYTADMNAVYDNFSLEHLF